MDTYKINGFKFWKWGEGAELMIVESRRLAQCVAYCNDHSIRGLHISPYHGYKLDNLDFLADCRDITRLHVQTVTADLSGIYACRSLQHLSTTNPHNIDFSKTPKLRSLSTQWNPATGGEIMNLKELRDLAVWKMKTPSGSLRELKKLAKLKSLAIFQSPILALAGIETLPHLQKLMIAYCPKLFDISALSRVSGRLQELDLDACRHVHGHSVLQSIRSLRILRLCDCGEVDTIRFIRSLKSLQEFAFVGTKVLDCDISPRLGLDYAGFDNKRGYSHTFEEVGRAIQKRAGHPGRYGGILPPAD